ncbi:MAG TPA: DUF559 domain-containing protein [Thermoanaerobaculia bacterium]
MDGQIHDTDQNVARDSQRDAYLKGQNYIVLRFPNQRIFDDLDSVLLEIAKAAGGSPNPWLRYHEP